MISAPHVSIGISKQSLYLYKLIVAFLFSDCSLKSGDKYWISRLVIHCVYIYLDI